MKLLRTSFSHLVREKIIQGQSRFWPEPADVPIERLINNVSAHTGKFEYQADNHTETGLPTGNYYNQGSMGYGDPPIGPGTKPYTTFISNKTSNLNALEVGIMTGDPDVTPSVSIENISYKGFGATFAIGQPLQYRFIDTDSQLDCAAGVGKHVLVSISGLKGAVGDYESAGWNGETDNTLNFIYETTGDTEYSIYVERADGTLVSTPQTYNHFVNSYGRMMPISIFLDETGSGSLRVDNSTTTFNIGTMTDKDALNYQMPNSGTLGLKLSGLTPHVDVVGFGMEAPISRLTNVAVNDNDDTDGCGDVGLPPFIHGITCSPIRGGETPDSAEWEFPALVHSSTDKWTAFSENNPTVSYGLSAIMDNQTFDTRGVATDSLSADLDIYLTQQSIIDRIAGANVTNTIEAINIKAYNAATFNQSELAVKIHDTSDTWDTNWTVFPGLYDDPEVDSHVTFFSKLSGGETCHDFEFSDFEQDMVIKLRAQNPLIAGDTDDASAETGGVTPPTDEDTEQPAGGVFVNKTTNYLFHNCQMSEPNSIGAEGQSYVGLQGPPVCEFSRDGSILIRAWKQQWDDSTTYVSFVEVLKIEHDTEGNMATHHSQVGKLRSNIASSHWGHCAAINDDGTIIAVADKGVSHASGGHGVIVMHKLDLANETIAETQIIYPPLSNQDYTVDGSAWIYDYESIEKRNLNVRLSGDGKIMIASFAQNYTAANPKSIFIYNLNESNQQYELVQTINGIGFQDIKLSKDGTTLVVKCGYFPASINGDSSFEAGDYLNAAADFDSLYFHGLKIFKKNSQNTFVENASLSIFDLGIEQAVRTADVDWTTPVGLAFGGILDINRYGNAIVYQFPDQVESVSLNGSHRAYLRPKSVQEGVNSDRTGPVAVITWDGTNWNRLGDFFLYDSGTVGYQFRYPDNESRQPTHGGINEDGTLLMLPSRHFEIDSDYKLNFNWMKWTGSSWSKITKEIFSNGSNYITVGNMGSCMSKQPHPIGKSLIGFLGSSSNNVTSRQWAFTFSEECSTELLG